jgi:hypothetical protein
MSTAKFETITTNIMRGSGRYDGFPVQGKSVLSLSRGNIDLENTDRGYYEKGGRDQTGLATVLTPTASDVLFKSRRPPGVPHENSHAANLAAARTYDDRPLSKISDTLGRISPSSALQSTPSSAPSTTSPAPRDRPLSHESETLGQRSPIPSFQTARLVYADLKRSGSTSTGISGCSGYSDASEGAMEFDMVTRGGGSVRISSQSRKVM